MSRKNDREASESYLAELRSSDSLLVVIVTLALAPLYAASRALFWIERKAGKYQEWK